MTKKEYAHKLAQQLKQNPTKGNVTVVIGELLNKKLSEEDQNEILDYIEEEIGGFQVIYEHFEIQKQLSVMQMAHQMIAQANAVKTNTSNASVINKMSNINHGGKK